MSKLFLDCRFLPVFCGELLFPLHIGHFLFVDSCSDFETGKTLPVFHLSDSWSQIFHKFKTIGSIVYFYPAQFKKVLVYSSATQRYKVRSFKMLGSNRIYKGKHTDIKKSREKVRNTYNLTHPLLICTWFFWKIDLDELDFWFISNLNFAGYPGSKNLVQTRQKFQFIKLDFSNSIFQNPSADRYRNRLQFDCHLVVNICSVVT